jgi:(S)-mandelate dehydrogenase
LPKLVNVFDYQECARRRLARIAYDYLERGAEDEVTMRRNREILSGLTFNPRVLTGSGVADLSRTILGRQYPLPLVFGPVGFGGLFWPKADLSLARAAARAGIPYVLPTLATETIEEVAKVAGPERWFQLYPFHDEARSKEMIDRARAAGYTALVVTVDTTVSGRREATMRHGGMPMPKSAAFFFDVFKHPRWTYGVLRYGAPRMRNLDPWHEPRKWNLAPSFSYDATFKRLTWDDMGRLRSLWNGALIVKGIQSIADARHAAEIQVEGIVLSNHGGRQLDCSPSPMEILPEVAAAIGGGKTAVMIDSGFRRGSDIVKALALGADAVWLGRVPFYGVAAAGEKGVSAVLNILREEMETTMALVGVDRLSQLGPQNLR